MAETTEPREITIQGQCQATFEPVQAAFAKNFAERGDVGASVAVTLNGEYVVDLWAGHRDAAGTQAWEQDTLVNVYSTTKTMAALCALVLADRGEIDFYAPVAKYWPEFAANGKRAVEVRHFMSHTAGLSGMDTPVTGDALYDWDFMVTELAKQAPWWEPGSASGYHALTQGHLIGEVVRRVTGQTLGQFFQQEIAEPLAADFYIGTPDSVFPRIGELIPPQVANLADTPADDTIASRTFRNPAANARASRTAEWRKAEIPAANGHGNARSVVRVQTVMANGGEAFGKRLLSDAGTKVVFDEQSNGTDLVLGTPLRFGMGYGLTSSLMPMGPNPNTCYWGGWGGSSIVVDQDARLCVSYVMNKMEGDLLGDLRGFSLLQAAYESLANG